MGCGVRPGHVALHPLKTGMQRPRDTTRGRRSGIFRLQSLSSFFWCLCILAFWPTHSRKPSWCLVSASAGGTCNLISHRDASAKSARERVFENEVLVACSCVQKRAHLFWGGFFFSFMSAHFGASRYAQHRHPS